MATRASTAPARSFEQQGFVGPVPLLTRPECRALIQHLQNKEGLPPHGWEKCAAVADWLLYRIAADPRILDVVKQILGEDIVLWGCSKICKRPGEVHPWHVDIETSLPSGRYVSVWIGLENTRRNGALDLIAGSHRTGKTIQQIQHERGYRRGVPSAEMVLEWARELNAEATLVTPELNDGEALLFDGHLWHGSRNLRRSGTRTALLLQFASADSPVRRHDDAKLEWPFEPLAAPKPPAILLHGAATTQIHALVPPPMPHSWKGKPMLATSVLPLNLPLAEQPGGGWKPYQQFGGATRVLDHINCHVSILSAGCCPHSPHAHHEEELLIILDGKAELVFADDVSGGERIACVGPGDFAYYPAFHHHTIRNPGPGAVTYLMFKWHVGGAKSRSNPIGAHVFSYPAQMPNGEGWLTQSVMEGPTQWLGKLHCHASWLSPGAGYEPHVDPYDVAILTLSSCVETLGQKVEPHSVVFCAAGEEHGMRNPGDKVAHYLVFEFHPSAIDIRRRLPRRFAPAVKHLVKRSALSVGLDLGLLRERLRAKPSNR